MIRCLRHFLYPIFSRCVDIQSEVHRRIRRPTLVLRRIPSTLSREGFSSYLSHVEFAVSYDIYFELYGSRGNTSCLVLSNAPALSCQSLFYRIRFSQQSSTNTKATTNNSEGSNRSRKYRHTNTRAQESSRRVATVVGAPATGTAAGATAAGAAEGTTTCKEGLTWSLEHTVVGDVVRLR